ncbi:IclR family transcriptional regulator [Paenibacillus selenitireducens]|uniref:Glycerol operon regulatory protein n=1 Tax=Paenibacillus selenitireducens TaxID=1324314 RepID=A0A1T2X6Q5_9BACL|nr:IclR family transcriptional regulator [Paenibacillus selenitireducens]OPA75550.1 IclR family transcriptional regulator [Paenibacillus selenitireducens]
MEERKLTVRAVERALDILICFTTDTDLGLTEISSKIGLHKSTVHRLLTTLEEKGFITRNQATEKYRLGMRVWELAANQSQEDDPAHILLPEMERLRDVLGETVSLYLQDGKERIRIQAVQSNQAIRRVAPVGMRAPLSVGASSKVLIAFAKEEVRAELLESLEWVSDEENGHYVSQLSEIQALGYATSFEEREPGAAAVSVPIYDRSHHLAAALSVSGPVSRLSMQKMKELAPMISEAAGRMGKMLK